MTSSWHGNIKWYSKYIPHDLCCPKQFQYYFISYMSQLSYIIQSCLMWNPSGWPSPTAFFLSENYFRFRFLVAFNTHIDSSGISLICYKYICSLENMELTSHLKLWAQNHDCFIDITLCNWLSLWRLVSWINHLPPASWSTFWKSTFKQQLGCRFDIMDSVSSFFCILTYAIVYLDTSYHFSALS